MNKTGIVKDQRYLRHKTLENHPENPRRLEAVYSMLESPDMRGKTLEIPARTAKKEEILPVHSKDYLGILAGIREGGIFQLTPDTHASAGSYPAALLAAGGMFEAIDAVVSGDIDNAFVLARPPGHHAERSRALGFCLLNIIALGAVFARRNLGLHRILIVDWDVHHGNGTQHTFENDPEVLFFSTHQFPHFPGTGLYTETGMGAGEGFTMNIPLPGGYGDGEYISLYETLLRPVALDFNPELILVSAGFDTHSDDPMGGMKMTAEGFTGLTRCIMDIAHICCEGKLVLCLEGGYHLEALVNSMRAVLNELSGATCSPNEKMTSAADHKKVHYALKRIIHVHQPFWKNLKSLSAYA